MIKLGNALETLAANQAHRIKSFTCSGAAFGFFVNLISFTGSQKEIGLKAILAGIEIIVAPMQAEERFVITPFYDPSRFHD